MIWFFTDPHYHHKNIVRGVSDWTDKSGCRDFETLEEHNDWIVDTLNAVVKQDDIAYCLGDVAFGGESKIIEFRQRLNCAEVHLLLGNHDHHIKKNGPEPYGFASAQHYLELVANGQMLVLSHYPIESWCNMERGAIHLHGHVHGNIGKKYGRYEVSPEAMWVLSLDTVQRLPRATDQRHKTIAGGNQFGT